MDWAENMVLIKCLLWVFFSLKGVFHSSSLTYKIALPGKFYSHICLFSCVSPLYIPIQLFFPHWNFFNALKCFCSFLSLRRNTLLRKSESLHNILNVHMHSALSSPDEMSSYSQVMCRIMSKIENSFRQTERVENAVLRNRLKSLFCKEQKNENEKRERTPSWQSKNCFQKHCFASFLRKRRCAFAQGFCYSPRASGWAFNQDSHK